MASILFTGGGSAGHVVPNLALIKKLNSENWNIYYVGSRTGIEKEIISKTSIPYYEIYTGKLRRYFSWQNFIDPFQILFGVVQSLLLFRKLKPNVIFSKGGFVAFPVVFAAWLSRVPIIVHESDLTVGLSNRLCFPFASKICVSFPQTAKYINKYKNKILVTGIPMREDFFCCDSDIGRKICDFDRSKKMLLVFGGSLGAESINKLIRKLLPILLKKFYVAHICGENKIDKNCKYDGYKQFTYLHNGFYNLLVSADLVISRSGANSIYELISLRKPSILIPIDKNFSRGDQIINAKYCSESNFSVMILQQNLNEKNLLEKIEFVEKNYATIIESLKKFKQLDSLKLIYDALILLSKLC